MFRTSLLALAIGAAALLPTVASAKGPHGGHHGGHGFGGFGITVIDRSYVADDTCSYQLVKVAPNLYKKRWICG